MISGGWVFTACFFINHPGHLDVYSLWRQFEWHTFGWANGRARGGSALVGVACDLMPVPSSFSKCLWSAPPQSHLGGNFQGPSQAGLMGLFTLAIAFGPGVCPHVLLRSIQNTGLSDSRFKKNKSQNHLLVILNSLNLAYALYHVYMK